MPRKPVWILAAVLALGVLAWGLTTATAPPGPRLTPAAADDRLAELAERFGAALENERDVSPLRGDVAAVVADHPGLVAGHRLLGQIDLQRGDTAAASAAFGHALRLAPGDAELQHLAGTAAAVAGDLPVAEARFRAAVEAVPDDARFRVTLGDALLKRGQTDAAEAQFTRALELRLMAHEADVGLADVYRTRADTLATGDPAAAATLRRRGLDALETALGKLIDDGKPRTATRRALYARKLAQHYLAAGESGEALALLEALPEDVRLSAPVLAEAAACHAARGQPVAAALSYERAARRRPGGPQTTELLLEAARWYDRAGDTAAAAAARAAATASASRDVPVPG